MLCEDGHFVEATNIYYSKLGHAPQIQEAAIYSVDARKG